MANELTVSASIAYSPSVANQVAVAKIEEILRITMTGADHSHGTQVLAVTEEVLDVSGDLGTVGMCFIKNLEASGGIVVSIGLTGSFPMQLKGQEFCLFRANGTIYVKAASGTPSIQYWAYED